MNRKQTHRSLAIAVLSAAVLQATAAHAATLPVANGGALSLSESTTANGSSPFGSVSALGGGNYSYGDSFTSAQAATVGSTGSGFFDDFVFTIAAGQVDSVTSSVSLGSMLGISGMKVTLYDYNANGGLVTPGGTPVQGSAYDPWSSTVSFPGGVASTSVLPATTLTAGTYVIEVRGTAVGSNGGNYTGSLDVTPVPLPGGLSVALGGMGLLAASVRRRRATVDA